MAVLVAGGGTNREIARTLCISERTVETHVLNILNKLGFQRRADIAAWAVRERLVADRRADPDATRTYLPGGAGRPRRLR